MYGRPSTHCHLQQVPHNINFREKKPKPSKKKAEGGSTEEGSGVRGRVARFRYFEDIYGYSGVCRWLGQGLGGGWNLTESTLKGVCLQVFICGPSPHWLLVTGRGALRLHPMGIDGPIDSFAPFHNVNCPRGFLYFNRQVRRRSLVPASHRYCPWPEQLWKQRAKTVEPGGGGQGIQLWVYPGKIENETWGMEGSHCHVGYTLNSLP